MRWGFMNSVRTEPRVSLLPYSTKVSSPALKIMHTWERMRLSHGRKVAWNKTAEGSDTGSSRWLPLFSQFWSPTYFFLPLSLSVYSPSPATCHPSDTRARKRLITVVLNQALLTFSFSKKYFSLPPDPCQATCGKEEDRRNNPDDYLLGDTSSVGRFRAGAISDWALVPMVFRDGIETVQLCYFLLQDSKPPGSSLPTPGTQHQNISASY